MSPTDDPWTRIRRDFACTESSTYLDTATYGPGPRVVVEELERANREWASGTGVWKTWDGFGERARHSFAALLGAAPEGVALHPSVSTAAAQIASGLPVERSGRAANLVVGESEFRSNLYPWLAQAARGLEVRVLPFHRGTLRIEELEQCIDDDTVLCAVSSVQSSNGFRIDLERLSACCRRHGAWLAVDATQSAGALCLPLELCDFVFVTAYKWLLAPRGSAFLYVRPELVGEFEPLAPGWKTPPDPYAGYYGPPLELSDTASRFDVSVAWSIVRATAVALDYVRTIGPEEIEPRVLGLAQRFRDGARELGLTLPFGDEHGSQIVGLSVPDADVLATKLEEARVRAAVRDGYLRVSFHLFNDEQDVGRVLEVLRAAL